MGRPAGITIPNIQRFMEKIYITDSHWLWTAATNNKGYGCFWDNETRRVELAHVWSYKHFIGPVPSGYDVHHNGCPYKHCVRPGCLQPLSRMEHDKTKCFSRIRSLARYYAAKSHDD